MYYIVININFIQVKLLNRDLSENVDLLTLEPRSDGNFLLRLEHIYDDVDKKEISKVPAVVPLKVRCALFEFSICLSFY